MYKVSLICKAYSNGAGKAPTRDEGGRQPVGQAATPTIASRAYRWSIDDRRGFEYLITAELGASIEVRPFLHRTGSLADHRRLPLPDCHGAVAGLPQAPPYPMANLVA